MSEAARSAQAPELPKALPIVAWIQLLCGLSSVAMVVSQAAHNRYFLDFGVL